MMKALVACQMDPDARRRLADSWDIVYLPRPTQHDLPGKIRDCELLILRSGVMVTAEIVAQAKHLRAVIRAGSGIDNLPVETLHSSGVRLYTIPGSNSRSVAELGIGLALSLLRHLPLHQSRMALGVFSKGEFRDHELTGQAVGLLGAGAVGQELLRMLACFECKVMYLNRTGPTAELEATGAHYAPAAEIFAHTKVIFVQVPTTTETHHLINEKSVGQMKHTPILVNLARWDVLDVEAVLQGLSSGVVGGLAIDPVEPAALDCKRFESLNCIFTPHIGGTTEEAQRRVGAEVVRIAEEIAAGASRRLKPS